MRERASARNMSLFDYCKCVKRNAGNFSLDEVSILFSFCLRGSP